MLYALSARTKKKENKILTKGFYNQFKFRTLVPLTAQVSKKATMLILLVTLTVFITSGLIFLVKLGASRK
jgi:hypothetical protein